MNPEAMDHLIDIHLTTEKAGGTAGAVSVYTDDVEHDVVGAPHGPLHGPASAERFYEQRIGTTGDDFSVIEHVWTGTVPGSFLVSRAMVGASPIGCCTSGSSGDGRISRENVWLDGASAVAQLTAPADDHQGQASRAGVEPGCEVPLRDRPAPAFKQMYGKLPAKDVDRARAFFAEELDLRPFGERDNHLYSDLGGAYFIIFPSTVHPQEGTTSWVWSSTTWSWR